MMNNGNLLCLIGIYFLLILKNEWMPQYTYTLTDIIDNFNYKVANITKQYEFNCLTLMKDLYDIREKYQENMNKKNYLNNEKHSINEIILSGTRTLLIPTYINIVETLYFTVDNFVSYIINTNTNNEVIEYNKYNKSNNDEFILSNIYCLNTFHIHIELQKMTDNENQLILIGDKLDYYLMLQWVDQNIQLIKNDVNGNSIMITSIYERLNMLHNIVQQLYILVNYSFIKSTNNTIISSMLYKEYIRVYLNDLVNQLDIMLVDLQKSFPIQEKYKRKILELTKEKYILQELDYNITLIETDSNYQYSYLNLYLYYVEMFVTSTTKKVIHILITPFSIALNEVVFSKNGLIYIFAILLLIKYFIQKYLL